MEENNIINTEENNNINAEELHELLQIRRDKLAALQAAGKNPFDIVKFDQTDFSTDIKANYEAYEGKKVSVAGRMMSKRVLQGFAMRKAIFKPMFAAMISAKNHIPILKHMTLAICSVLPDLFSKQKQAKSPFMRKQSLCFQNH